MRGPLIRALLVLAAPLTAFAQTAAPPPARRAELPLDLDWKAPPECASETTLRGELARIAHLKPGRTVSRLSARGQIEKQGELYRLTLRTERSGETGERTLAAPECRALEREVTLVLALAFGEGVEIVAEPAEGAPPSTPPPSAAPEATRGATAAAPPEEQPSAKPPGPAPRAPAEAAPREEAARPKSRGKPLRVPVALTAGGGLLLGVLPRAAPYVSAGLDVGSRRFWVAPRLLFAPAVDQSLPRGVTADYTAVGGALSACLGAPSAILVGGCAGATVIALRGESVGASESGKSVATWYAATASLLAQWPPEGAVSLRLEAQLDASLARPRFVVDGLGETHHVPALAGALGATIVVAPFF